MCSAKRYYLSTSLLNFLFTLLLALLSANSHAVDQKAVDSLNRLLVVSPEDTGRAHILYALWQQFIYDYNELAMEFAQKQYNLAKKLPYRKGLCMANYCLGYCFSNTGDYSKALSHSLDALKLSEELNDTNWMIASLQQVSSLYYYQDRYAESLNYMDTTLRIAEMAGDDLCKATTLNSIGTIYLNLKQYEQSNKYYKLALEKFKKLNRSDDMAMVLGNLGEVCKKQENYALAMQYYDEAVQIHQREEYRGNKDNGVFFYTAIAEVSGKMGNHKQSIQYFNEALSLANEISESKRNKRDIYEKMAAEYERAGDYRNANIFHKLYKQYNDSLISEKMVHDMAELTTKYETEKKDKAIKLLEKNRQLQSAKVEKQQILIWSAAGGILLLAAIAVLLGILWQKKKRAHRSVSYQMEKFSKALEQSDDLVVITDRSGIVQFVNHGFEEVTGFGRSEVIGTKAGVMLKSGRHDQEFYRDLWETVLSGNVYRDVLLNRKKNGELYYEAKTITPVKMSGNAFTHFISTGKDITEKIHNEEKLAKTNGELNSLLYRISHELRAPLVTVMGLVNVFRDAQDEQTVRKSVDFIEEGVKKMDTVLADINMINIVRQGRLEPIEIAVSDLTEDIFHIYREQKDLDGILLASHIENGLVVTTDLQLFHSILHNLIDNAIKYRKKGIDDPRVLVIGGSNRNGIYFSIEDNGRGMKEEISSKVFDLFFKGDEFATGSGLGLYIVKSSVEKLGGTIKMETAFGKGTKFDIYLPHMDSAPMAVSGNTAALVNG